MAIYDKSQATDICTKSIKNKTIRINKIEYTNETPGLVFVWMLGKGKGMKKKNNVKRAFMFYI